MAEKRQEKGNWNIPEINLKLDDGTITGITNGLFSPRITSSRLHVTIDKCVELRPTLSDLEVCSYYCIIEVEHQQVKTTSVKVFDNAATWAQNVNFDLTSHNSQVFLTVWAHGNVSETTQKIGGGYFEISTLSLDIPHKVQLKINQESSVCLELKLYQHQSKKITEADFMRLKTIGKGSFGTVYLVRKIDTRNLYAMKVLIKHNVREKNAIKHTLNERAILKRVDHPFIVNLKFAFQTKEHLFMVMPYMNGGELFFHLSEGEDVFGEERAKFYAAEITLAIAYLHENGVLYRDLKPENILLDMEGHISIVDFGLSKTNIFDGDKTETFCGSLEYMPPELLAGIPYTNIVDWWALATMVYEMIYGLPPFWDEEQPVMLEKICACAINELEFDPSLFSPDCIDFIKSILQPVPEERLGYGVGGSKKIKKHPWFKDIDWTKLYYKQVTPPFRPHVQSEFDMRYFDKEVLALDPSKLDFAKPKHKRLLEIDDNFENFSFEEVNAVANPTTITPSLLLTQSGPKGKRRSGDRRARRSVGSHYGTSLSEGDDKDEKFEIERETLKKLIRKSQATSSAASTESSAVSESTEGLVPEKKSESPHHEKKQQRKGSFTKFFVSPTSKHSPSTPDISVNENEENKQKQTKEHDISLKASNSSIKDDTSNPQANSPRLKEASTQEPTSTLLHRPSSSKETISNSKDSEKTRNSHKRVPTGDSQPREKRSGSDLPRFDKARNDLPVRPMSLQNPKNDLISHMSGSSPSSPLIKTSTSDKYIKPSTLSQEDEEKLAKVPELPILTSSPIKNRVSRSSSEGNLRSTITNRALFDRGGLSYRETTTPDPLFPEDKKKKGFNTFKKLVMGGSNVDVNSAEKAQEKAERAQEKAEKKKDRLSFRLSQGANTHSKEKERLKSSKPTSRDDEEVPKDDSNPSQDKKLKGKSLENLQQSSTSPHGSSQSSKKHFS